MVVPIIFSACGRIMVLLFPGHRSGQWCYDHVFSTLEKVLFVTM